MATTTLTDEERDLKNDFECKLDALFRAVGPHNAFRLAFEILVRVGWSHQREVVAAIDEIRNDFPKRERSEMHSWIEERDKGR